MTVLPIKFHVCLFAWLMLCGAMPCTGYGQTPGNPAAGTDSVFFSQWVKEAEKISPYHFYFDSTRLSAFRVFNELDKTDMSHTLERFFEKSPFHFAIDRFSNVFVVEKIYPLQNSISPDFFNRRESEYNKEATDTAQDEKEGRNTGIINAGDNMVYEIGVSSNPPRQGNISLAGYVRDEKSGEAIAGATVSADNSSSGVITDQFGYYSLNLPAGQHQLTISSTGMKPARRLLILHGDGKLNIELREQVPTLKTVVVVAERNSNVKRLQMGVERLNIASIKSVPVLLGEADILRVVLTLPGVSSVGDASTGFNVRGGSADQNLVLFNDATIYNPSHLFGFFSAFNPDVIKGIELYKSTIPEKYGGRLSSVLDVSTRDGNNKKWAGTGGIGFLTSKFSVEGPIVKDRTSIIIGARTTYSNWLLRQIRHASYGNSRASFYDLDLHITHIIDPKNSLYLTAYTSKDRFTLNNDTLYKYGNNNIVIKWKHNFNNKLYVAFTGGLDDYQYSFSGSQSYLQGFELKFGIRQYHLNGDFSYSPNNNHTLNFGVQSLRYELQPGILKPFGSQATVVKDKIQPEQALESALYFGDKITLTPDLSFNAGIRYSYYNYLGPKDVNLYMDGLPKETSTIRETVHYGSGKNIKNYQGPEIRMALRYSLSATASVKASYNTLRQYIHLLYNTTAISPTDIWKLSDPNIRPQAGQQISLGFYKNLRSNSIETSIEVYYKKLKNFLDYKSGANLVFNHHIETDVISTKGHAYGAEFLIRKPAGKLNGWISYTYSRTMLQQDDSLAGQKINGGNEYPANFDKPHNLNLIMNYRFSHRYSISFNSIFNTGRPITLPIAIFYLAGSQRVFYSERNQYRIPNYFRMDFSVNIEGNHKVKKITHNSWSAGVYNLTARKNPYSVYFVEEGGIIKGYKLSVIGTAIPFITYNFRF